MGVSSRRRALVGRLVRSLVASSALVGPCALSAISACGTSSDTPVDAGPASTFSRVLFLRRGLLDNRNAGHRRLRLGATVAEGAQHFQHLAPRRERSAVVAFVLVHGLHEADLLVAALADEVLLLEHGRIQDRGTVAELTERSPLFRELTGGSGEEPLFVPEDEEVLA